MNFKICIVYPFLKESVLYVRSLYSTSVHRTGYAACEAVFKDALGSYRMNLNMCLNRDSRSGQKTVMYVQCGDGD